MITKKLFPLIPALALGVLSASAAGSETTTAPATVVPDTATVVIQSIPGAREIPADFTGFSYEKSSLSRPVFDKSNTALVALFNQLGPGTLRIGGSNVDSCHWDADGAGMKDKKISPPDLERLAGFVQATGWKVLYGINLVENTPERAANEAACAAKLLKEHLLSFEIGNEPDLYNRGHRSKEYGVNQYITEWTALADAIDKAVPDAAQSGPATSYNLKSYALPMSGLVKGRLAELNSHYYIAAGPNNPGATIEAMLTFPDKRLESVLDTMRDASEKNGHRQGFRLAEINSFYSSGKKDVSDTHASALWAAETLFTCAERGAAGINFHVAGFSPYTPILHEPKAYAVREVRPEFYGLRFFTLAASGKPMRATVKTTGVNRPLRVHAVAGKDGVTRVALINVNAAGDCTVTVDLPAEITKTEYIALTGPSLGAKKGSLLGGAPINTDGSWNPGAPTSLKPHARWLRVVVPPASAMLISAKTEPAAEAKQAE